MKRLFKISLTIVKIICITIIGLLIVYSAVFSIGGTYILFKSYKYISAPVKEVEIFKAKNPVSTIFMDRCLEDLVDDSTLPDTLLHTFLPLDSISKNLVDAVLAAEDDGFYLHPGIDLASVLAAAEYNKAAGKNKHGASTITQQMAKNLFLSSERTFERKIKELVYAILMEKYLGKDRILELYLNYAQWGKNIFGCEAASLHYYKKSAKKLSKREAAWLAAVLAKPSKLTPHHKKSIFLSKRISVIAQNLYLHHTISDSEYFHITGVLPTDFTKKDTASDAKTNNEVSTKDSAAVSTRTSF